MPKIIVCGACGETGKHRAHGWCTRCYSRWLDHGKPHDGPPAAKGLISHEQVQGTVRGWFLHRRRTEAACAACRVAWNAHMAAYYRAHPRDRSTRTTRWTPQQEEAALAVAARAAGRDDCRALLQMLGLLPQAAASARRIGGAA